MTNQEYIGLIACTLTETNTYMDTNILIDLLNTNGFKQQRGGPYVKGGRGIFKLLSSAYKHYEGDSFTQNNIATRFVEVGTREPAWVKYEQE